MSELHSVDLEHLTTAQRQQWTSGVVALSTLSAAGISRRQRDRLVAAGELTRVRRGWFARRDADPDVRTAVLARGRLTCVSILRRRDVWMPVADAVHVRISHGVPSPTVPGITFHRVRDMPVGDDPLDDVEQALACAFACLEPLDALIVADSVANRGVLSEEVILRLAASAPKRVRRMVTRFLEPQSQSGTETIVRYELRRRGYRVRVQRRIPATGSVDLLVGDRLVLECDSRAHHTSATDYAEDRRRDLESAQRGYHTIRLTFEMVRHHWDTTWPRIARILAHRQHRWTSRTYRMAATMGDASRADGTNVGGSGTPRRIRARRARSANVTDTPASARRARPEPERGLDAPVNWADAAHPPA